MLDSQAPRIRGNKKACHNGRLGKLILNSSELLAGALELAGELLDAARGIDEALFTGVSRVRIHRHITNDDEVFLTVDLLLASGLHGGLRQETFAGGNVEEADIIEIGMAGGFHRYKWFINPDAP